MSFGESADRLPGQAHAISVNLRDLLLQTKRPQLLQIRPEGVGFQTARARFEIIRVHFADQLRLLGIERFVDVVRLGKTTGQFEQIGAHRSIDEERLRFESSQKIRHSA